MLLLSLQLAGAVHGDAITLALTLLGGTAPDKLPFDCIATRTIDSPSPFPVVP